MENKKIKKKFDFFSKEFLVISFIVFIGLTSSPLMELMQDFLRKINLSYESVLILPVVYSYSLLFILFLIILFNVFLEKKFISQQRK